jgi:streptogramin lyase
VGASSWSVFLLTKGRGEVSHTTTFGESLMARRVWVAAVTMAVLVSTTQTNAETISGKIVDANGKAMEGVTVSAFDEAHNKSVSVFSQADGSFTIDGLRKVEHTVRARLLGQLDEYEDEVEIGTNSVEFAMTPAEGEDLEWQRTANSGLSMLKFDNIKDKENFKMMCTYCHQAGTLGFRTPEKPVDWETMIKRMDGFGGLHKHTQETIVKRLVDTYSEEAVAKWPKFEPPAAPTGAETKARITEWDMGKRFEAMIHDIELDADGLVYAVDLLDDSTITLDPVTGKRERYPFPKKHCGPHSIELGNDGNMWYTLCYSGEMAKFNIESKEYTLASSAVKPRPRGMYPHTLRINPKDPEGLVWYTDAGGGVYSMHPETMFVKHYRLLSADQAEGGGKGESRGVTPYGIDFSPYDGMIWYTKLNGNRLGRIDPSAPDGAIKEWIPPFAGPRRHHVDQDGIVWVPGFGSGVLGRFDPKTEEWKVYPLPDADNQIPYALNIDPKGYVWICGTGDDTMLRFDPDSESFTTFRMPSRVTYTREIEFDADGNVWVCNSNGPSRHTERGYGSIIKIEILDDNVKVAGK